MDVVLCERRVYLDIDHPTWTPADEARKDLSTVLDFPEHRKGEENCPVGARRRKAHKLLGTRDRKTTNKQGIDQCEYSGIGADPQRKREQSDARKAGRLAQHAQAITQVLGEVFDDIYAAGITALLLGLFDAAELDTGAAYGFRARDASADQVIAIGFDMETEFRVHLALHARASEDCLGPGVQAAPQAHTSSGLVRRIPVMTSAMLFHLSASVCNLRFPAAVRR